MDIRHVYIRPPTPHLNGRGERSHRVDNQEFYQLLDQAGISNDTHLFNDHRPNAGFNGQTPYERLVAATRAGALPTS